jgi:2-polyprenyl-3-methyl-5-hydroxy-6-metoxy-1,4-benzoquinol methylase
MESDISPFSNSKLTPFITCKDYTVSRETFDLLKDDVLELLITSPKPKELEKYYESEDYISHTDSKKSVFDKVYQFVKNYTIKKKVKLIETLNSGNQKPKTILDIGCGTGDFLLACKTNNWQIIGVEPNLKAQKITQTKLKNLSTKNENFKLYNSITELDQNDQFDIITMWHVLEHVPNLEDYIIQLKKLLKLNGSLIIAVPNYKSYDAQHYEKFWAAYDVPRHLWHFSQTSIKLLFQEVTMKIVKTLPMKFDSFYVSLLSEKYKTGKSNIFKAIFVGWRSNLKAKRTKEYSSLIYVIKNE